MNCKKEVNIMKDEQKVMTIEEAIEEATARGIHEGERSILSYLAFIYKQYETPKRFRDRVQQMLIDYEWL